MTIQHSDQYFKVVSTKGAKSGYGRSSYSGPAKSALLNNSPHTISYGPATPNGSPAQYFVAPRTNGTPILMFAELPQAQLFAKKDSSFQTFRAEVYGEVVAVTNVLKLNLGWSEHAIAFWEAVLKGEKYVGWKTRSAPAGTLALFGVMRLLERIN